MRQFMLILYDFYDKTCLCKYGFCTATRHVQLQMLIIENLNYYSFESAMAQPSDDDDHVAHCTEHSRAIQEFSKFILAITLEPQLNEIYVFNIQISSVGLHASE